MQPLQRFLEKSGMTQAELAARIGVTAGRISQILNSCTVPGLRTAIAIERETKGAVKAEDWLK